MKSLNQFSSRKEWENYIWQEFAKILSKTNSENQIFKFLNILLTEREKKNLVKKLVGIALIKQGKNYREISELLWLSPNTVSAIKKGLKNSLYKSYHDILKNKKSVDSKTRQQFQGIDKITVDDFFVALDNFGEWLDRIIPPISGKGRWRFLNH